MQKILVIEPKTGKGIEESNSLLQNGWTVCSTTPLSEHVATCVTGSYNTTKELRGVVYCILVLEKS